MKVRTKFLTRCLSLVLALVFVVSSANLGLVLNAYADGEGEGDSIPVGQIVANNYLDLTDGEKALLSSGLLAGGAVEYTVPADANLITIDKDNAKVIAEAKDGWIPVSVKFTYGGSEKTVDLVDGECTYNPEELGNSFSVAVTYCLEKEIDAGLQTQLLNTAGWLKQGVANLDAAYAADANLGTVVLAMPTLVQLANGIDLGWVSAQFGPETISAVSKLNNQLAANGGDKLNLQVKNAAYGAAASKVEFLLTEGGAYKDVVADTYAALNAIKSDELLNNSLLDQYLQSQQPSDYTKWMALKNILGQLVDTLAPVAADAWTAAEKGTALVAVDADYAELDAYVAVVPTSDPVEVKNPLLVAETTIQKNLDMQDVKVKVVLNVVGEGNEVAANGEPVSVVLTLTKNVAKADILAAVEESGIVDVAKTAWGEEYVEGQYVYTATELPETLTEDIEYVITFNPVKYTVTLGYGDAMTDIPYGYKYTLPAHEDDTKAYDYTVNGVPYAQGEVITITETTEITREEGKAYSVNDLYTIVADNYGNDVAKAILKSGALFGNEAVNVREPDPTEAEELLDLAGGVLSAEDYLAAYAGLSWVPYTYGAEGNENYFSGNEATGIDGKEVKVQYVLSLTNVGQVKAQEILDLAAQLKEEADAQKDQLDRLDAQYGTMEQLDKAKLGAMTGVINVTDFTPGDGTDTDAKNLELRAYFNETIGNIINNNLVKGGELDGKLMIFSMLKGYKADGLRYYYNNSEAVIAEIENLAAYLGKMTDEIEALTILLNAVNYGEYAEKIGNLETLLNEVLGGLTAPNAAIDLGSASLGKLLDALVLEGKAEGTATAAPYLLSKVLTAMSDDQVNVQIIINTPAGSATVTTPAQTAGTVLEQGTIAALLAAAEAKVAELLGENAKYYSADKGEVPAAGTVLNEKVNVEWTYAAKTYTVVIEGEEDQTISIDDLEIDLPKHPTAGWVYKYTVDGVADIVSSTYTFTAEQIDRLFTTGSYTITRVASNEAAEKVETAFGDWLVKDKDDVVTGINAQVAPSKDGIMNFAMTLLNSGYSYIALNDQPLLYLAADNSLEISLQTIIDAVMNDETFGSQTLINLGEGKSNKLVAAKMDLGNSAEDVIFSDLDFVLNLDGVPSQMATVAKGLKAIAPYMTFKAGEGVLDIQLSLPEKVYEVYLTAMLATGNVDKDDITALNSEIAFQFLWDYVQFILDSEATTASFTNTLNMLGVDRDLTGYEDYYQMLKKALNHDAVSINPEDDNDEVDFSITGNGKTGIDKLISLIGIDTSSFNTYLGMIKEYKGNGTSISAAAKAELTNAGKSFEAAYVDVKLLKDGAQSVTGGAVKEGATKLAKGVNYTTSAATGLASIAEQGAMILLSDVKGDLVFNGTTGILDLNGHYVDGVIVANGKLIIVDSTMNTYTNGGAQNVTGNAIIMGGKYGKDVSALVKDGYVYEDGYVHNVLYTMAESATMAAGGTTNVVFNVNTDLLSEGIASYTTFAKALAVDVVVDLVLNYYTAAALAADGNEIYGVELNDLIGLLTKGDKIDNLIAKVLNSVNVPGMSDFVNVVLADVMDFAAIEAAAKSEDKIFATYTLTTAPWAVELEHVTDGDYISFGVTSNDKLAKNFVISLQLTGSKVAYVEKLAGALAVINNASSVVVDVKQPVYTANSNVLSVEGSAVANFDFDMTRDANYATIIAVLLANGGSAQKAGLVAAINSGDMVALKEAFDKVSVKEIFDAMKKLNRGDSFAALASKVGVTIDVTKAAELEGIYHLLLCAAGKVLEELEITGYDSKMSGLDKDGDGVYVLTIGPATRKPDASYRGYSVYAEATAAFTLKVKLFSDHVHSYTTTVFEPTCYAEGYTLYECACGDSYKADFTPKADHTWGPWQPLKSGEDCQHVGTEMRVCANHLEFDCGGYETRDTDVYGPHKGNGTWLFDDDYHWQLCELCGEICEKGEHDYQPTADGKFEECSICHHKHGIPDLGDHTLTIFATMAAVSGLMLIALYVFRRKYAK